MQEFITILVSQLTDPFRIGLLVALLATTIRNAAATGWVLPLAAGIGFVAYIIAMTMPVQGQTLLTRAGIGIVSNAFILGVLFALWRAYSRFQK